MPDVVANQRVFRRDVYNKLYKTICTDDSIRNISKKDTMKMCEQQKHYRMLQSSQGRRVTVCASLTPQPFKHALKVLLSSAQDSAKATRYSLRRHHQAIAEEITVTRFIHIPFGWKLEVGYEGIRRRPWRLIHLMIV